MLGAGRRTESLPALFCLGARDGEARARAPPFPPLPAAPAAPRPLAPAPFLCRGRRAQPAAARRGPRAPPPFPALPSPSSPPDTMTGPEQCISRVSLAAAAPAPGEAAGGGSCGERSREPGLTERAGGQDGRTPGRRPGHSCKCGPKRGRAASGSGDDERPRAGDAAGAGCPASPGVGLRGSRAEQELGPRGGGRGRQAPGKARSRVELLAGPSQSRVPRSRALSHRDNKSSGLQRPSARGRRQRSR